MKQLPILIRREFWENRTTFLFLPAITTGVVVFLLLILLVGLYTDSFQVSVDADIETNSETHEFSIQDSSLMDLFGAQLARLADMPESMREDRLDGLFTGVSVIWFATLWVVIIFYLLGALYDDRRDRSVLFWKSMPVSDTITVVSKLLAGLVLAPLIYLVFIMIAHLAIALVATIAALGQDVSIWSTLWAPAHFVTRWVGFLALYGFIILWCLPFFGWLLLVSSWAKSAPLAWAVGIPVVLVVLEGTLLGTTVVSEFAREHMFSVKFLEHGRAVVNNFELPQALEFASSLIVGMGFIALAVWRRGKADEI
ncbi:MAG: ABC-2 type transport system permease protein [Candidatus Azotimanducaceae bacterium]|jgi:ABC-2 type transport system permease protein